MTSEELLESPPPVLSATEASEIAASLFGIAGSATALAGERDANFRIVTDDGDFSLKIANPAERATVLEMQQFALEHVATIDEYIPAPRPVHTRDGSPVGSVEIGGRTSPVRLLTFLPGTAIPRGFSTPLLRGRIGVLLARLDLALHDFHHPEQKREYLWDVAQMGGIRSFVHHLSDDRLDFVSRWMNHFDASIAPRLVDLPHQVIHSDFNPENVLVDPGDPESITGIIDFADLIYSPRVIDPASAAAYQCLGVDDPAPVVAQLVGAYHEVAPLSDAEIGMVADLVTARLVQSLAIGAWRADLHPDNRDYILIHAEPVWNALSTLSGIGAGVLHDAIRETCAPG